MPQLVSTRAPGDARGAEGVLHVPVYVDLGDNRVLASFGRSSAQSDGIELRPERSRTYPGLRSVAPRTDAIYRAFSAYGQGHSVLDIGTGSGAGLAQLSGATRRIGVDASELAIRFATRALPGGEFHCLDATQASLPRAQVAMVVDVLGAVSSPLALLRRASAALSEDSVLCLAEPSASAAQELMAPMVRALSRPELISLVSEAGFVIEEWLSEGRFWVTVARKRASEWVRGLEAADQLFDAGLVEDACALLGSCPKSEGGGLEAGWYLRLFRAHQALGQGDRALAALMEGHQRAPDDSRLLTALAEATLTLGARDDSERFAKAALERDPASSPAHRALARALKDTENARLRISHLSSALRLDPSNVELGVSLAIAAADAQICFVGTRALLRVRDYHASLSADFHLTLGWLHLMSGRIEDALLECKLANVVGPEHPGTEDLMLAICEAEPNPLGQA